MLMILAEYAAANADGTFTVVRGGIDIWKTKSIPFDFQASLLLEVAGSGLPRGFVNMRVSVRDASGATVCEFSGSGVLPKPDERIRAAIHIGGKIASVGPLVIEAQVGLETARQVVNVQLDGEN